MKRSMLRRIRIAIEASAVVALAATAPSILKSQGSPDGCGGGLIFLEQFDTVTPPQLPFGWVATNVIDPDGIFWVTSNSGDPVPSADSPPNAAFINDAGAISDKRLDSPNLVTVPGGQGCVKVIFRNNFRFQDGFDGGVLEVSINGAGFQDVLSAGGIFESGGYNGTVSGCCGNPLAGRQAWTGNSGGFFTTTVRVPIEGAPNLVLRWRIGTDISGSGQGWRIDTVIVAESKETPPPPPTPTPPRGSPTPRTRPSPAPRPTPSP